MGSDAAACKVSDDKVTEARRAAEQRPEPILWRITTTEARSVDHVHDRDLEWTDHPWDHHRFQVVLQGHLWDDRLGGVRWSP
jgi:hypothetical protein